VISLFSVQTRAARNAVSLAALTAALLMPAAAFAQDAAAPAEASDAAAPAEDATVAEGEAIVVTGSRLSASGFTAPTPVTVLGTVDIERQAVSNVADLLNTLPAFRAQSTPATTAIFINNAGANLADLRGLGAQRTLVLVDGRRFVAGTTSGGGFAPSGTVDLNMIPTAMIRSSEVVTGGASAAYGSDAVAGVVNLLLDTKFTGLKGSAQYGVSDKGDNQELFVTLVGGTGFAGDRGHIVIGGEYADNKGMGDCYTRDWCAEGYGIVSNGRSATNGLAGQLILPNVRPSTASWNGLITSGPLAGTEFRQDGSTFAHDYGTYYGAPIFQSGGSADPVNAFFNNFPLVAPVERYSVLGHADYEFSDSLKGFVEASYGSVTAKTIGAQGRILGLAPGDLTITRDNAYLPAAVRAQMDAAAITSFGFGRILNDIGPQRGEVKRNTFRTAAGLDGQIAPGWSWNAYYQYGETNYHQRGYNSLIVDNYKRAADAVTVTAANVGTSGLALGSIACRSTLTAPGNGCAPLNLFGENNYSAASAAYITGIAMQDTKLTQHVAAISVNGELFQLPGGPLSVAFGGEYRVDDVEGTADAISTALRFYTSAGTAITGPATTVKEGFLEVGAPILADAPFAYSLSLNGAVRVTDYSTSGSVTSWKAGGVWDPIKQVRFRVTRSRDIRAPNFFELYSPRSTSFQSLVDPQRGNATALSLVNLGGNTDLKPEIADTLTAGIVLSPINRLKLSVDYYDIKLDGAISTLGGQVIVSGCATGTTAFCDLITRGASTTVGGVTTPGQITSVTNVNLNLNTLKTRGIDIEASYSMPVGNGELSLRLLGTRVFDLITVDATGKAVDRAGMNGAPTSQPSGLPKFTGNAYLTYSGEKFTGTIQARYLSSGVYNATQIGPHQDGYTATAVNSINDNYIASEFYLNLNAQVDIVNEGKRKLQLFGVVNNLLDNDPPNDTPSSFGATNPVLYDVVGRSYKIGVRFAY